MARPRVRPLHNHRSPRNVGMNILDTLTLIVSFLVALLACCMLLELKRLGASLKLLQPRGSPSFLPHPSPAHLPRTRLSISPLKPRTSSTAATRQSSYGYLTTRPDSTLTMLKQAVNSHNAAVPPPSPTVASRQQSLGHSFARNAPTHSSAPRPLMSNTKQNGAGRPGLGNFALGTKRTATGLAKSLSSQEDPFSYPNLQSSGIEKENYVSNTRTAAPRTNSTGLATALFDEDDFDSDVDLDVEDPATKGTVRYPSLPQVASSESRDSGYLSRPDTAQSRPEPDSSQQIPWSSSPIEHFKTPQKPQPAQPKARRAFLPWSQNQQAAVSQRAEDWIEGDEEEAVRPKKRQTIAPKPEPVSTPASKSQYLWNTTASALKQQQKNLREQNKKKEAEAVSVDDLKDAAKKKRKNAVARLFLSEEQQHVLNLVTEQKKSVFFTGSAGMFHPFSHLPC